MPLAGGDPDEAGQRFTCFMVSRLDPHPQRTCASPPHADMTQSELLELIANGEGSGVELERDDVRPEQLAKEIVALANFQGGVILLGVEDDGTITGIQRCWPASARRAIR